MKNFPFISFIALMLIFCVGTSLSAQTAATSKNSTVKIKTSAECDMCKEKLEKEVGLLKGVKKAELDLTSQVLTVDYNPKKVTPEKIREVIAGMGYDADDVKANNRARQKMPKCCTPGADTAK
ncbi:MAG TPA: heavy metal-associated domain-containing protein [Bacteroidia bacterium]|nr:heavy metal-associated domain-containing protein [Bacteroidia bacterium]